jgi:hypothetical protein
MPTDIQSIVVNVLRVRYRKERRQLISDIILQKKVGSFIDRYIKSQAKKLIPEKDRLSFMNDVREDLADLDPTRIYGLGVTLSELRDWKKAARMDKSFHLLK